MTYLRNLGLAAMAALALIAFVGAGTASAETTLCTTAEANCAAANMFGPGAGVGHEELKTVLKAGTEAKLKAIFGIVKCKASKAAGNVNTTTTPEIINSEFEFTNCNCPQTVEVPRFKEGELQVHWDAESNGNGTIREFEVKLGDGKGECFFNQKFECTYRGVTTEGITIKAGNPATLVATEVPLAWSGGSTGEFICGKVIKWSAEYEITAPKPLFVSSGL